MSGIGSVSQGTYVNSLDTTSASRLQEHQDTIREEMDAKLDEVLESAGMDEETRESLRTALEQALQELFSGKSVPADPSEVKQTIDGVFEQYGLSGEDIMGQLRPSGGPPPGMAPPPSGGGEAQGATGTEDTSQTDLLETLLEQLSSDENDSELGSLTPEEMVERILDTLFGIDEEA